MWWSVKVESKTEQQRHFISSVSLFKKDIEYRVCKIHWCFQLSIMYVCMFGTVKC